jgi:DNA-binding protein Fis
MTLGCGSWGGNVTSDNISPLHLMDIKRVAFETRPVKSVRPARTSAQAAAPSSVNASSQGQAAAPQSGGKVSREDVAAIVDRFLSNRNASQPTPVYNATMRPTESPAPVQPMNEIDPNWAQSRSAAAPHAEAAPTAQPANGGGATAQSAPTTVAAPAAPGGGNAQTKPAAAQTNGHKAVDFVSEEDVRRAVQKGEKIYVNAKTIITPSARDIGEPAEIFAKI